MNNSQCSIIIKGPVLQWNTITYITHTITYTTPSLIYQNSLTQVKVSQFELTKPISKEIENEISKKTEKVEKLISYHSLYDKLCAKKNVYLLKSTIHVSMANHLVNNSRELWSYIYELFRKSFATVKVWTTIIPFQ